MGWHVPNDGERNVLINFLDGGFVAGWKLKETGTSHWQSPNTEATNSSGFTALPGGSRAISGIYGYVNQFGYFWSSSPSGETGAWFRVMNYYNGEAYRDSYLKTCGLSVRCVKD